MQKDFVKTSNISDPRFLDSLAMMREAFGIENGCRPYELIAVLDRHGLADTAWGMFMNYTYGDNKLKTIIEERMEDVYQRNSLVYNMVEEHGHKIFPGFYGEEFQNALQKLREDLTEASFFIAQSAVEIAGKEPAKNPAVRHLTFVQF